MPAIGSCLPLSFSRTTSHWENSSVARPGDPSGSPASVTTTAWIFQKGTSSVVPIPMPSNPCCQVPDCLARSKMTFAPISAYTKVIPVSGTVTSAMSSRIANSQ